MKKALNYLGQVRLYSLIDLALLLLASHADTAKFLGSLFLWLGFLSLLEARHKHTYRENIPYTICVLLFTVGFLLYGGIIPLGYIALSLLYTLKNKSNWGIVSPFIRGLQTLLLIVGITGFSHFLPYLAGFIIAVRNMLGDARDVTRDRTEKMKTFPIILGLEKSPKNIHLFATLATATIWWLIGGFNPIYLLATYVAIVTTYSLTPR